MESAVGRRVVIMSLAAVVATLLTMLPSFIGAAAAAAAATGSGEGAPTPTGSNCTRSCGNISIPYPFGIEPGCYHAAWFNLTCNHSYQPPKLFLGDGTVQVLEVSVPNGTVRINSTRLLYTVDVGVSSASGTWGRGLPRGGPFFLSESRSSVAVVGCGAQVDVRGGDDNSLVASCAAVCPLDGGGRIVVETSSACAGVGCCQANIVLGYDFYSIQIHKLNGSVYALPASVYFVDQDFRHTEDMSAVYGYFPESLPATLEWVTGNFTCPDSYGYINPYDPPSSRDCFVSNYSVCLEGPYNVAHRGSRCGCEVGYQGNPYVRDGCQDINECTSPDIYPCYGDCKNIPGDFICLCPHGYYGNASVPNGCQDMNECEDPEAHSCYGVCLNLPGTFRCECPSGTYGNSSQKLGCVTIKSTIAGEEPVGGDSGTLIVSIGVTGLPALRRLATAPLALLHRHPR